MRQPRFDYRSFVLDGEGMQLAFKASASGAIQFCPAAIAQNTSSQNRHQFTVLVASLDETLAKVLANGGKQMGEKIIDGDREQVGIMDPDQNSMVLMTII